MLRLSTGDFAGMGRASSLDLTLQVPVGITLEGCTRNALEEMERTAGLLLLTEKNAAFEGKEKLVEVSFR
jgi:hypothetical protein